MLRYSGWFVSSFAPILVFSDGSDEIIGPTDCPGYRKFGNGNGCIIGNLAYFTQSFERVAQLRRIEFPPPYEFACELRADSVVSPTLAGSTNAFHLECRVQHVAAGAKRINPEQ